MKLLKKLNLDLDFSVRYVCEFLTVYTVVCFISNHINGQSQDTLTTMVFTVLGLELGLTMLKKWLDKKYGKDELIEFNTDSDCSADSGSGSDYLLSDSVD